MPESKRYAEDKSEYAVVLGRYDTVLDGLFAGGDVYVITPVRISEPRTPLFRA
ncbi:hypothetical protein ABT001_04295 [Streptomyces sp. NPDC002793]|uniref:DUF3885 domain-containing protein n=1 Tax=Streptomyces sp. NPDC002793 TaxID=3154432 RepID=UPI00331EC449